MSSPYGDQVKASREVRRPAARPASCSHAPRFPQEVMRARVPINFRDNCVDLLIPLNQCRFDNFYLPWKCEHERHAFEKCEYEEYMRRVKMLK